MSLIHEKVGELCWWRGLVGFPPGHFAQDTPWEEKTSQNAGLGPILWVYYPGAEPSKRGRLGLQSIPGGLESARPCWEPVGAHFQADKPTELWLPEF